MSEIDSPAGTPGGPVTVPTLDDLPEKMRVHALARLLGRTSREVLATLAELGVEARSAQSSIVRKVAEQVVSALLPDTGPGPARPAGSNLADPAASGQASDAIDPGSVASIAGPFASSVPDAGAAAAEPARVGPPPLAPLFAPPAPLFQAPVPVGRRARKPVAEPSAPTDVDPADTDPAGISPAAATVADNVSAGDDSTAGADDADADPDTADEPGDGDGDGGRRRRRRGRRGRGRGRGADGTEDSDDTGEDDDAGSVSATSADDTAADETAAGDESSDEGADEGTDDTSDDDRGSSRRRRRRRRRGSGDDAPDEDNTPADPPNTVTRVRQPRTSRDDDSGDGVQSVRGSTRLEAKRQRRRDGRDAGRRRVPILTESEFLARRESVDRAMVVRERGDRIEIGVLEDDVLVEHFVTSAGEGPTSKSIVGNIYLGRVQNVLPSMEAAFVDIGRGRNAVLYAGEVDWDAAGLGGKARRIEQALSSGDSVLVQVTKDPLGHKGARLTTQISLAGRFLVYVPSGGAAGISRKLPDVERRRLKDMLKEIVPSDAGVIIRTASEGVSHQALERDVRRLQAQWDVVKTKSELTGPNKPKAPVLLYEEPDMLVKVVRDQFNEDFSSLVVAGDDAWDTVSNYVGHVAPELAERMHRYVGPNDVFAEYRVDEQLLKALDRKVWLPSGGTLVIDRTEAMTVVDVNTGKFTGSGGNLEETVTRNNLEAAEEVVRQLRLRDIGGIIVIDFIDMVLEANRDLVLRRLTECLARDRTRHQVAEVTSLGLVQMTRKRVGGGLLEHFSVTCEHCRGRGVVVTAEPVEERVPTGRGPEREGRRSRGGRGRRGDEDRGRGGVPDIIRPDPSRLAGANGLELSDDDDAESTELEPVDVQAGPAVDEMDLATPEVAVVEASGTEVSAVDAPAVTASIESVMAAVVAGPSVVESASAESPGGEAAATDASVEAAPEMAAGVAATVPIVDAPSGTDVPAVEPPAPMQEPVGQQNGHGPVPRQRRARVRRTAGAPTVAGGEAAVAVVTVAAEVTPPAAPAAVGVPPQPEPTAVSRPRRARRAASRPAGPPVAEADPVAADSNGGDPV